MNKILIAIFCAFLLVYPCSCSTMDNGNAIQYAITDMIYSRNNGSVSITYPQISGMENDSAELKINNSIKTLALEVLGEFTSLDEMEIEVTYTITYCASDMMSLYFVVGSSHHAQAYPLVRVSSATYYCESGNSIELSEMVDISDDFITSFFDDSRICNDYYSDDDKKTVNEYVHSILSTDELAHSASGLCSEVHGFLTDDSLIISVSVPKVMGSYVLYEAKYEEIGGVLKLSIPLPIV